MAEIVCKAATLTTPSGVTFLAFFDFDGGIKNMSDAAGFYLDASVLFSVPMTISFRQDGNKDWQTYGYGPGAQFLSTLPATEVVVKDVVIQLPEMPT